MMCGTTFASWMVSSTALPIVLFGSKSLRKSIRPIWILFAFAKLFLQLCAPIGVPNTIADQPPSWCPPQPGLRHLLAASVSPKSGDSPAGADVSHQFLGETT